MDGIYSGICIFLYCEDGTPEATLGVFVIKRGVVDKYIIPKYLSSNGFDMAMFGFC